VSRSSWVTCPGCRGRIYCDTGDLRHKKWKLRCPYCNLEFNQEDSPQIDE
jgi:predicted Zn finger-like uncharacterized protein